MLLALSCLAKSSSAQYAQTSQRPATNRSRTLRRACKRRTLSLRERGLGGPASTCEGLCLARTLATSGQRLSPLHWSFTLAWTPCSTSQYTTSPPTLRIAGARQRMHARTHARTHSPSLSAACVRLPCDVCAWARAQAEGARPGLCTGLWLLDACCGEM